MSIPVYFRQFKYDYTRLQGIGGAQPMDLVQVKAVSCGCHWRDFVTEAVLWLAPHEEPTTPTLRSPAKLLSPYLLREQTGSGHPSPI
jgi:hypothetical protein